jgi:hypothetical protein
MWISTISNHGVATEDEQACDPVPSEELPGRATADDERRRYYRLTPEGREAARREMARMSALLHHAR